MKHLYKFHAQKKIPKTWKPIEQIIKKNMNNEEQLKKNMPRKDEKQRLCLPKPREPVGCQGTLKDQR